MNQSRRVARNSVWRRKFCTVPESTDDILCRAAHRADVPMIARGSLVRRRPTRSLHVRVVLSGAQGELEFEPPEMAPRLRAAPSGGEVDPLRPRLKRRRRECDWCC